MSFVSGRMNKKYQCSLFIFRRDLRLIDNTALIEACRRSESVIPIFIFDPRQVRRNSYRSINAMQFMLESLRDLDSALHTHRSRLFCWEGKAEQALAEILHREKIDAVFVNRDYTPFSLRRDRALGEVCKSHAVPLESFDDVLLTPPGKVLKKDGKPYTIFTPFYKAARQVTIEKPQNYAFSRSFIDNLQGAKSLASISLFSDSNQQLAVRGGRCQALKLLQQVGTLQEYEEKRNLPTLGWTTQLSAHNKFGTVSIREVYHAIQNVFGPEHSLIRELFWRDFFCCIGFYFAHVFKGSFHRHYDKIIWENNRRKFKAWCTGMTGFPIVDAGMRELNATGFMHNRVRMIVASVLTKDLHINWQWGERYFAQKLVDYDPAVNNGNWQWAASTGCDAQPYFRIFNPWLQQERFDPDCTYIKRWVPELRSLTSKEIHKLSSPRGTTTYPPPIVDHREAKDIAEEMYIETRASNDSQTSLPSDSPADENRCRE